MDSIFPDSPDVMCKTLYNSETVFSRCVGYCTFHNAYVTSQQMKTKHCLQKQCNAFIKNPGHEVWIQRERRKAEKKRRKLNAVAKLHIVPVAKPEKRVSNAQAPLRKKRYICLDLEMNELTGKQRKSTKGLPGEVIQIGAVMLDENGNYLSEFATFVKPIFGGISEEITALTGICDADVANADVFTTAFYKLYTWAGSGKDDITTLCWSASDYKQLWDEIYIKARNHDEYRAFLKTFVDLQAEMGHMMQAKYALSLDAALKFCHLRFAGQRHTAIADAFNTARIFHKLMLQKAYELSLNPLWKYTETEFSKRFNAVNSYDKDFTTSFASFIPDALREKLVAPSADVPAQAGETRLKETQKAGCNVRRFYCTKYGIRISDWARFSLRMWLVRDMKVAA